uniref:Tubulin tyrosine ligase like 10 n=1 Tax=Scleropages formosus TaxID=113540 RepID=A0A8C9RAJ6_SCLFO
GYLHTAFILQYGMLQIISYTEFIVSGDNATREDYTLKWCETKSVLTYYNFREGEQLLYQIPNNKVLTTKIGLLNSLRDYEKASRTTKSKMTSHAE